MRRIYFVAFFLIMPLFISCSEQIENKIHDDLYVEMVNHSHCFESIFALGFNNQTKTGNGGDINPDAPIAGDYIIDITSIDEKFITYFDTYTQPEDIADWDEESILESIANDPDFSDEERTRFSQSISLAYYVKNNPDLFPTVIPSPGNCYQTYKTATNRALRRAVLTLFVGLLEPTIAAETLAVVLYVDDMNNAQLDFAICMANTHPTE